MKLAGEICFCSGRWAGWLAAGLVFVAAGSVNAQAATPSQAEPWGGAFATGAAAVEWVAEVRPVDTSGPVGAAKASAPPKIDDAKAEGRLKQCKLQWTAADSDGNGLLTGDKITRYNSTIRTPNQPILSEDARLTQDDFMKACMAVTVHE